MNKTLTTGRDKNISFARCRIPGTHNEDTSHHHFADKEDKWSSFAIYDGHNGASVAKHLSEHLYRRTMDRNNQFLAITEKAHNSKLSEDEQKDALFCCAFNESIHDEHIHALSTDRSGSTMVGLFLRRLEEQDESSVDVLNNKEDEGVEIRAIFANIGDSRGIALTCHEVTSMSRSGSTNSLPSPTQSNHNFSEKNYDLANSLHSGTKCAVKLLEVTEDHTPVNCQREIDRIKKEIPIGPMTLPVDLDCMEGKQYSAAVTHAAALLEELPKDYLEQAWMLTDRPKNQSISFKEQMFKAICSKFYPYRDEDENEKKKENENKRAQLIFSPKSPILPYLDTEQALKMKLAEDWLQDCLGEQATAAQQTVSSDKFVENDMNAVVEEDLNDSSLDTGSALFAGGENIPPSKDVKVVLSRSTTQRESEIAAILSKERGAIDVLREKSFLGPRKNRLGHAVGPVAFWGKYASTLLMTRSIGDRLAPDRAVAIADLTAITVRSHQHMRIVLASDGMWDVLTLETVRRYGMYYAYKDPKDLAVFLACKARRRRKRDQLKLDDITVIVVDINPQHGVFIKTKYSKPMQAHRCFSASTESSKGKGTWWERSTSADPNDRIRTVPLVQKCPLGLFF